MTYLALGLDHIVTGLDHVFLVICFALGIGWSRQLIWVVSAFTMGHSITLVMGIAGFAPQIDWFIPTVELAIALTVILAAIAAWNRSERKDHFIIPAMMAACIGLVHGFGFASFLSSSLTPTSSTFAPALAGFNIGLEIGQILLILATITIFGIVSWLGSVPVMIARWTTLSAIALVSSYWVYERLEFFNLS